MQFVVIAEEQVIRELTEKTVGQGINLVSFDNAGSGNDGADAYFILNEEHNTDPHIFGGKPVFLNSVKDTLSEKRLPDNFCRINGWPGFIKRDIWEVACNAEAPLQLLDKAGWKYKKVGDEPGLVSARLIAMIINEAYFALGEEVSSKKEIDLAMKLGTNYPYGPFEWSEKIGLDKIYSLLTKLSKTDNRYTIAPALLKDLKT